MKEKKYINKTRNYNHGEHSFHSPASYQKINIRSAYENREKRKKKDGKMKEKKS